MARLFDDAASEYLQVEQAVVTVEPFTLAAWAYSDDGGTDQYIINIADKSASDQYYGLNLNSVSGAVAKARAFAKSGTSAIAESTINWAANEWLHIAGVFVSSTERSVFLNGGNKGTNTDAKTLTGLDRTRISSSGDTTPVDFMSGRIAEVGVWNVVLTDAEVAILAKGFSPLLVRPQSLIAYWPLIRDEDQDRVGGYDMTAFNTPTIGRHPPIIYPSAKYLAALARRGIYITHA